jgi:uncharacterized protein
MSEDLLQDVTVTSGGLTLRGVLASPGPGAPLVVLCHGIPLSRPDPSDPGYIGLATAISEKGYAALFVNFRGCGTSEGNFSLGGWHEDLAEVMRFARETLDPPKTFMAGFSAGGAQSIRYAAENHGVDGVATFAAPARLTTVFAREHLLQFIEATRDIGIIKDPDFPPSPEWFFEDMQACDAFGFVEKVSPVPLLIVHGEKDELIPLSQGRELFEAAGDPRELVVLAEGEHRLRHDPRSIDVLLDWIQSV